MTQMGRSLLAGALTSTELALPALAHPASPPSSACCVGSWAAPIWSPARRSLFAADSADGTFLMNADGNGLRRLAAPGGAHWPGNGSPADDDSRVAETSKRSHVSDP